MPDHIYQHIWTYLMGAYVVPMKFNWQLLEGLANYPEEAEVFHKAHAALQEAVKAGRVTVVWVPVAQ